MTMRVAFDARALDLPYLRGQGIGRYTAALLDALGPVSRERGGELVVLRTGADSPFAADGPGPQVETWRVWRPPVPDMVAIACEQALLRRDLHRIRAHVLHSSSIYRAAIAPGIPSVVALHDVIPLLFAADYMRSGMLYRLMYAAARRADLLLTVSERARRDIVAHLDVPSESVVVVPGATHPRFRPTPPDPGRLAELGITQPYVLYVGGLAERDPRKGVEELIDSFAEWAAAAERPETLVLTGRLGAVAGPLRDRARRAGGRIVFTGFVPDDKLPAVYSGANCLVTCSRYEGFGLPELEAVACGTPVAAYRVGAHEEVVGPGALLVDEGKTDALMLAVQVLSDHHDTRVRLAEAGKVHAARFSWWRSAELTWEAYERVAVGPRVR